MAKKSFLNLIAGQWSKVPPVASADLKGKTVIVVGANTGLGFEATQHFARMSPGRLILACRDREKGEAAITRAIFLEISTEVSLTCSLLTGIQEATGYSTAELWLIDLAVFDSVKAFVDRSMSELQRLDIFLLNAATTPGMDTRCFLTKDGWEKTYTISPIIHHFHTESFSASR
jgi:NAD(P)-dependent dehydrogenase (short-subunit alcohol dehydrogenase family)